LGINAKELPENSTIPGLISFTSTLYDTGRQQYSTIKQKDVLYVMQYLGHKKVESTLLYIQLEQALFQDTSDEFTVRIATKPDEIKEFLEAGFDFVCQKGQQVYDHVMKSGAGTTFYYSLKPSERERLAKKFVHRIDRRYQGIPQIRIVHQYVVGVAICRD